MAFENDPRTMNTAHAHAVHMDVGLRQYMLKVYNYMASGIALTGIVAFAVSQSPEMMQAIFGTPLKWVVMLAPLGFVFFLSARINKIQAGTAQALFWVFAALMGASLASVFIAFTGESVTRVFFITAASGTTLHHHGFLKDATKHDLMWLFFYATWYKQTALSYHYEYTFEDPSCGVFLEATVATLASSGSLLL